MAGFLDDLPDLGLPETPSRRRRPKKGNSFEVVYYIKVRCPNPECRSFNCPVQNTQQQTGDLIVRYHKCQDCNHTFKSIEYVE